MGIEVIKPTPNKMYHLPEEDMYVILEIKEDSVNTSQPMNLEDCSKYLYEKHKEQPLQYFNDMKRYRIIHLKSAKITNIKLKIDLL